MKQLNLMIKDLSNYHRPRNQLLYNYIQTRLEQSLNIYNEEMTNGIKFLRRKDEIKILKKANENE